MSHILICNVRLVLCYLLADYTGRMLRETELKAGPLCQEWDCGCIGCTLTKVLAHQFSIYSE